MSMRIGLCDDDARALPVISGAARSAFNAKGGLRTTKKDEQMHGYGTRIVARLAEKYNGCADYSLADGQFVAQVMLDMTEDKSHEN